MHHAVLAYIETHLLLLQQTSDNLYLVSLAVSCHGPTALKLTQTLDERLVFLLETIQCRIVANTAHACLV